MPGNTSPTRTRRSSLIGPLFRTMLGLFLVAIFPIALFPAAAGAHNGIQSYVYLDVTQDSLSGQVEFPIGDVRAVFDLALDGDEAQVLSELENNLGVLQAYANDHLSIGADGTTWRLDFAGVELLVEDASDLTSSYAIFPFTVAINDVPRLLSVRFDPLFDEPALDGERSGLLLISNYWEAGVFDNEFDVLQRFANGDEQQTVDLGDTGWTKTVTESIKLGIDHIRSGPDHVLFVLVLLIPAVLAFTAKWEPAPTFWAALWRILKIATMFTLAHSITFTLAGLDLMPVPPSKLVEFVIAASIALTALHNIRPVFPNKEWLIAFVFGLFHGLGFAAVVSDLDVSRNTQLLSLLGRNIGIEIGQAVVIVLMFPALFMLRRTRAYLPFLNLGSVLLALISLGWMIERLGEQDLGISNMVEPVLALPRALVVVLGITMATAAIWRVEHRKDRLLPVAGAKNPTIREILASR